MKPRYTVTVTDNKTNETFIEFDLVNINYKVEASSPKYYDHGMGITEYLGEYAASLNLTGTFPLMSSEEKEENLISLSCQHDWINYRGLEEEFMICGLCGIKK